jgi:hypothetical protein
MSRTHKAKRPGYPRSFAGDQLIKDWMERKARDVSLSELDLAVAAMEEFEIPCGPKEESVPVWLIEFAREAIAWAEIGK